MATFKRALNKLRDMLDVALIFTNVNEKLGVTSTCTSMASDQLVLARN